MPTHVAILACTTGVNNGQVSGFREALGRMTSSPLIPSTRRSSANLERRQPPAAPASGLNDPQVPAMPGSDAAALANDVQGEGGCRACCSLRPERAGSIVPRRRDFSNLGRAAVLGAAAVAWRRKRRSRPRSGARFLLDARPASLVVSRGLSGDEVSFSSPAAMPEEPEAGSWIRMPDTLPAALRLRGETSVYAGVFRPG